MSFEQCYYLDRQQIDRLLGKDLQDIKELKVNAKEHGAVKMTDESKKYVTIDELYENLQNSINEEEARKLNLKYKNIINEAKEKVEIVWSLIKINNPNLKNKQTLKFQEELCYRKSSHFIDAFEGNQFWFLYHPRTVYVAIRISALTIRINTRSWTCELVE